MQYFYISQGSELPYLRMELIDDGRYDFFKSSKFYNALQNANVTFSMTDENGNLKISEAPCNIVLSKELGCNERYIIEYRWNKRDTKNKGQFKGLFKIAFNGDLYEDGIEYNSGDLIVPIYEDLIIMVK